MSTALELSAAFMDNDRTRPILSGDVRPEGIKLQSSALYPTEIFWRQLHYREFDVSEMSLSSLIIATSKGNADWVGIPVFTMRRFFHTGVLIRSDRGIESPGDLAGKKVGVPEFQQTAALWTRGILRDEFGLDPASMEWLMERNPEQSHGGATGFIPRADIRLSYVPRENSLGGMLMSGELDALIHFTPGKNIIDRTTVDPLRSPFVRRLFDPPEAEAKRYYRKTGIFPINHCIVVRRSIAQRHPWVVLNVYAAFEEAKARTTQMMRSLLEPYGAVGTIDGSTRDALAVDIMPYGLRASRAVLSALVGHLEADGLIVRQVSLDEIFAKQTLDL